MPKIDVSCLAVSLRRTRVLLRLGLTLGLTPLLRQSRRKFPRREGQI